METEELRRRIMEVIEYDPETGLFRWKKIYQSRQKKGWFSGTPSGGYRNIMIFGRLYSGQRLAWMISYGYLPEVEIDHENHIRSDNRLKNLKEVTTVQNRRNASLYSTNKSGANGVFYDKKRKKWRACIGLEGGKRLQLGRFSTLEEAVAARKIADIKYGYHENHGKERST